MSKINHIILVIFLILLVGVFLELGFYVYITSKTKQTSQIEVKTEQTEKDSNAVYLSELFKKLSYDEVSFLRNTLTLNYEKKAFSNLTVETEIAGTVVDVENNSGLLDPKIPFQAKINIMIPNRTEPLPVYYSKEDLLKVSFNEIGASASVTKELKLEDLKKGDKITVKETYDLVNFHLVKGAVSITN